MRLSPVAVCAAALAIVTAGCASAGASGPGSIDGAAQIAPADAVAFVAASADVSSKAWHGLGTYALKQANSWTAELQGVAGEEVDVAVLRGDKTVAFVQPTDDAKLKAFAAKHNCLLRTFGDWTAVAGDAATLDTVANAKTHLSDNALYAEAMGRLPGGALVRAYANGDAAGTLLASIPGQLESRLIPQGAKYRLKPDKPGLRTAVGVGTEQFRWLAAALTSTSGGLRLQAFAPTDGLTASQPPRLAVQAIAPYTSALAEEIPGGSARRRRHPGAARRVRAPAAVARRAEEPLRPERVRAPERARRGVRRRDGDLRASGAADARDHARDPADRHGRGVVDPRRPARSPRRRAACSRT